MTDFIDKAILIGSGLEKTIKDLVCELEEKGRAEVGEKKETEGAEAETPLEGAKRIENRVVEEGLRAVRELLTVLRGGKERVEEEFADKAEDIADKLHLATSSELEIVREIATVAREKVERLEKTVKELIESNQ